MIDDAFRIFIGCYFIACGICVSIAVLCLALAPTIEEDPEDFDYYGHDVPRVGQDGQRQGVQTDAEQEAVTEDFLVR